MGCQTWFARLRKRGNPAFFAVALVMISAVSVFAQLPTGTILGTIKDSTGGVITGAAITIINTDTSATQTVTSGTDGSFRIAALPVGHYNVRVEHAGFNSAVQNGLVLDVAQEAVLNIALQVGTTTQEVVVTTEAQQVNTTTSS